MSSPKSPKKTEKPRFKCQHCQLLYKSSSGLANHIRLKHDNQTSKVGQVIVEGTHPLTPQEESFCVLYSSDKEFFGNGTQSYIEAFDVTVGKGKGMQSYEYCRWRASMLLKNKKILKRINEIYEAGGLNDAHVDKQLELLITQNAEYRPKLGAIQEYNKLKKRTIDTVQHLHAFSDIKGLSDDELRKEREKLQGFFQKK